MVFAVRRAWIGGCEPGGVETIDDLLAVGVEVDRARSAHGDLPVNTSAKPPCDTTHYNTALFRMLEKTCLGGGLQEVKKG